MNVLPKEKYIKNFTATDTKAADDNSRTLVVTISTPTPDRSKDIVQPMGMDSSNYLKNPVVQFAHKYDEPPIAKCTSLKSTNTGVIATVEFPQEGLYDKADTIYQMYKQGFLNAWSIGFMPKDYEPNDLGGYNFKTWELFEFSSVPVPDNPQALTIMRSKGINVDVVLGKGTIAYKKTPLANKATAWDAGEQVKEATVDDLKAMCAWVDSENADNKSAYKLPHHEATGEHAVVWNGVKAAGGAIQGAQGEVDIPDGDIAGVKAHLAKHYAEFDETPPWEDDGKAVDADEVETKDAKPEDETDLPKGDADNVGNPGYSMDTNITELTVGELIDAIDRWYDDEQNEDDDQKSISHRAVQKDVNEVIALGDILQCFSWYIYMFEQNDVSQSTLDKLNQALGLILQVVQEQAVLGQKTISFKDFPQDKKFLKLIAKAGRTISSKHEDMLSDAKDHMTKAIDSVQGVLDAVQPPANDTEDDDDSEKSIDDDILGDFFISTKEIPEKEENLLETLTWEGGEN